jgi:hypothetical protein
MGNRVEVADYGKGFWGPLERRDASPLTLQPVYPKRILSHREVLADGVSLYTDYTTLYDREVLAPDWFCLVTDIVSPRSVDCRLVMPNSRLWSTYGKLHLNGRTYFEKYEDWALDPRSGPVESVDIHLDKGHNRLVMSGRGAALSFFTLFYFDTQGVPLSFFSPFHPGSRFSYCTSIRTDLTDEEKLTVGPDVFDKLVRGDSVGIATFLHPLADADSSFSHPQIPTQMRRILRTLPPSPSLAPMLHENNEFATVPAGCDQEIVIDFGEEVAGYIDFEIVADEGDVVDVIGCEYVYPDGRPLLMDGVCCGFRYRARQGRQRYTSWNARGYRYLILTFRGHQSPVRVRTVRTLLATAPLAAIGTFACSDYRWNRIWEISQRTSKLCTLDTFVDCPGHEMGFWIGDFRNEALISYQLFDGTRTVGHSHRVPFGNIAEVFLPQPCVPCLNQNVMPTWALLFMISYWELYLYSGDRARLASDYPRFRDLTERVLSLVDDTGLIAFPFNDMVDWAIVDIRAGAYNTHSNAFANIMLRYMALAATELGHPDDALRYSKAAERVKEGIVRDLWDPKRQAFVSCRTKEGEASKAFSVHASIVAYSSGCFDETQRPALERYLREGFPEDFVRIGSPFASFFYHEALGRSGNRQRALDDIRTGWGQMVDNDATTCYETFPGWEHDMPTRSFCHAWSASPCYVAGHDILGVVPAEPGFRRISLRPFLGDLEWARGVVPTPFGPVSVSLTKRPDGRLHAVVRVPEGIEVDAEDELEMEYKDSSDRMA